MSTKVRPEVSASNKYWISKYRYYELKHHCLQFNEWKQNYKEIEEALIHSSWMVEIRKDIKKSNPTEKDAERLSYFSKKIDTITRVAERTDKILAPFLLKAIMEGYSFNYLQQVMHIHCCKDIYYQMYRRFFWLLDKEIE